MKNTLKIKKNLNLETRAFFALQIYLLFFFVITKSTQGNYVFD